MAGVIADDGYLYVFGGQDLKEGLHNSLWRVKLTDAVGGEKVQWENAASYMRNVPQYGFSHHAGVCFEGKIYFFGGSRQYLGSTSKFDRAKVQQKNEAPLSVNILELKNLTWQQGPTINEPRDDFAHAFDESAGILYMFGGFVSGTKTNDLLEYNLRTGQVK